MIKWTLSKIFKRARSTDPMTSHLAAQQIAEVAPDHFKMILEALESNGAMGKDGIAYASGLDGNQVARRLPEMQKLGLVALTGKTVESFSGRQEREWVKA